ncbi:efflux RND transporter permease subunit [Nitrincola schmidtii]|uniref:efflux RND transporter permease subunit n=1 Tax=Nitrincola schmidtii TaxID=1730894 RepID=UPI00124D43F5|nr:efflux RND transporter permease subunit [Nitrincola schmidtii]
METLIRAAMLRSRATLTLFVFLLVGGLAAYQAIPKEANPDVVIPMMYISMSLEGISPEDGERLLVRPMEQELRALEGVKKMTSISSEGHASVMLEFDAGFDPQSALQNVREKVDSARSKLPAEADEPRVNEINVALFPVLSVAISGPISESELVYLARRLKENIEGIPEVLEVDIGGDREDLLEIIVDPQVLDSYQIDYAQLFSLVSNNNRLVAAGSLDTGAGRMPMKVPGVIETLEDVLSIPVKVYGDTVITFGDIAILQRTFKEPTGFARINGQPGIVLEISKRAGANIIDTNAQVRQVIDSARSLMPETLQIDYIMDQSDDVNMMLDELLNNVLTAVVLVLILIIATMGLKSALMVGLTIPGAFLTGILLVWAVGYTLNIIVLFSLILVAGMLVDGAIVVSELADRYLREGLSPSDAWLKAASRMSWPIIASTATTLSVFIPLLFWPGVVGEFMKYLPATVILCLLASLAMALVFLPTMGSVLSSQHTQKEFSAGFFTQVYRSLLAKLLNAPWLTLLGMMLLIMLIYTAYGRFNHGVEFFPDIEPETLQLQVRARGDLSVYEKDKLLQRIEARLNHYPETESIYARSFAMPSMQMGSDVIGILQFRLVDWHERRDSHAIIQTMRELTADIHGIELEFRAQDMGPGQGKPVELLVSADRPELADQAVELLRQQMQSIGGFTDIEDDRTLPGIEWRLEVDREAAARFGADVLSVGNAVQLITNGLMLATYRPEDATDEVDIRVRVPHNWRSIDQLSRMTINTSRGQVPLSHFVTLQPTDRVGNLYRVDGERTITLQADIAEGYRLDERLSELSLSFDQLPEGVVIRTGGEDAEQREAAAFLTTAFIIAIFLMLFVLLIQFNSFFQTALVLSAVVFSTAGVLLGLLINGQSFGIVMVGMGIIALAGIVVNNNIILIDTYNQMRLEGLSPYEAALETGVLRLRPVLLTAITTILGLLPMVLGININLMEPSLGIGAPSTQWWTQLSSAIAGGLAFATFLTLLLTPCMLLLGTKVLKR